MQWYVTDALGIHTRLDDDEYFDDSTEAWQYAKQQSLLNEDTIYAVWQFTDDVEPKTLAVLFYRGSKFSENFT